MISKEKWAEIIKDFQEKELPEMVERDIEIPTEIPLRRSISIIGPRRAGKTYEMYQIIRKLLKKESKERLLYVNFERADIGVVDSTDLVNMLDMFYELYPQNREGKVWLFLDEIQNVSGWERFVRTALDENIRVYLSGSSSKMLSREIATSMRGRNITYTVFPFSFGEYLRAKGIAAERLPSSTERSRITNALRVYMEYGGYPEVVMYEKEREKTLTDIRETAIYKDVIERAKIRNVRALRLLTDALINSQEFSINKFYNFLKSGGTKVGKNVMYNYLEYLGDAFFVFLLRKFSYSYKHAEQSIPKVYFVDNGLLRISGIEDKGRLMENLVFVELMRRRLDPSYYKSETKEEVDFVIKDGRRVKQLIQVSYSVSDRITKERETKSLIKAAKELKCSNLCVINWDYEAEEKIKGKRITFIPLWKWLVGQSGD